MTPLPILLFLAAAAGPAPSEPREPGASEPWQQTPLMSGDRWARLRIDVDAHGRPLRCRIAATNLSKNLRFYACQAFLKDWRTEPVLKDGVAVPATVERMMVMPGPAHRKADARARKRYLAEHPEAR